MIIALIGPKGCGKSTLANQLVEKAGFVRLPFAGPLKQMIRTLLSIQQVTPDEIDSMLDGPLKEIPTGFLAGRTPRYAMQTLGTEWRDTISKELWSEIWTRSLVLWGNENIIVDDMRFIHEENAVHKVGGHIVKIYRPEQSIMNDPHISESEYSKIVYDFHITNTENDPDTMFNTICDYFPLIRDLTQIKDLSQ